MDNVEKYNLKKTFLLVVTILLISITAKPNCQQQVKFIADESGH
jgi:uncharacterized membrane protein YciS (DUF1049 family)